MCAVVVDELRQHKVGATALQCSCEDTNLGVAKLQEVVDRLATRSKKVEFSKYMYGPGVHAVKFSHMLHDV